MHFETITPELLARLSDEVGELRGWDFSRMNASRDPVPWDYPEVARRFLQPTDRVLDLGTGGEQFLELAPYFGEGVGIDAFDAMVETGRQNTPPALAHKVRFERMRDEELTFPPKSFDVVLCRHADFVPVQVADVLRPGGYFVTQGVGDRNTQIAGQRRTSRRASENVNTCSGKIVKLRNLTSPGSRRRVPCDADAAASCTRDWLLLDLADGRSGIQ